ncbi:MAG: alpha/beta fold hydrolase [Solirubrobacteraceae bacterium]
MPASYPAGLIDGWVDGWRAASDGAADYMAALLTRGPVGFDVPQLADVARRGRPSWTTPHEIVFDAPVARLRDFSTTSDTGTVPTLVLPPQAGHDSCIVDYSAEQSQMGALLAAGLDRALTLDWKGATPATADVTIDDYLDVVDQAVTHCGGRVNLIGDCQGGWLATIYAALRPERVNTLTLAGAPIDFHAGEPVIHELLGHLSPGGNMWLYESLVAAGGGVLKGELMLNGFIMIQPADEIARQFELLMNLHDAAHVARYSEFEDWFKHTQDIPGAFYLWIVRHLFRDNELVRGELEIGDEQVDLSRLDMPLQLLAGTTDHITPPAQVFAIAAAASTPDDLVLRDTTPGGHLGLFMGHQALREHWPALLARVRDHSAVTSAGG